MPNFSQIARVADAALLLKASTPDFVAVNADYLRGDHLRGGEEWIGPQPPEDEREEGLADLAKKFTPCPVVNECLENHVMGIVGREPGFELVLRAPPAAEDAAAGKAAAGKAAAGKAAAVEAQRAQINGHIGAWFDGGEEAGVLGILQEYVSRLRWAGRATLRLFVPPDLMERADDGTLKLPDDVKEPQDALKYIFLDAPNVESAMVYVDPRSRRKCGLFRYDETDDALGLNRSLTGTVDIKRRVEKIFVADKDAAAAGEGRPAIRRGKTVLQVLETTGVVDLLPALPVEGPRAEGPQGDRVVQEVVFPCGGYSLMFESRLPLLFTDPVRRLQRCINLINTLLTINAILAGFRSRDYFNAVEPSDGVQTGPAQALMWYSFPYKAKAKDGSEETQYLPVQLVTTEPVDSGPIQKVLEGFERLLRRAMRQEHTLFSGGEVSAVALIQMRAIFLVSLLQTKPAVESALVWLQGALWCFALYLSGHEAEIPAFIETYRATAQCKPYTGPLTPEEVRVVIEMVAARLMPREVAAGLLGVDDLDAYAAAIALEDKNNPVLILQRLQIRKQLMDEGVKAEFAAIFAGFDEETAKELVKNMAEAPKSELVLEGGGASE